MFEKLDMTRFRDRPVGIATGGRSKERPISLKTGRAFERALRARHYDVTVYDVAVDLEAIAEDRPAAMLLGIHGGLGEGGALQGFLESLEIPYTGSGVLASAIAMDKARARTICAASAVPVAPGRALSRSDLVQTAALIEELTDELGFPLVAKLNDAGSSFGVHVCRDSGELDTALQELRSDLGSAPSSMILVEKFVEGPEFTVGFFDEHCLGVIEVVPGEGVYDFEAKYESDETEYRVVAEEGIVQPLKSWSRKALEALGCRGVTRVDFKGDPRRGGAFMLEVNTIPGMTATSLVPKLAADRGVPFEEFVEAMLATASLESAGIE